MNRHWMWPENVGAKLGAMLKGCHFKLKQVTVPISCYTRLMARLSGLSIFGLINLLNTI